MWLRRLLEDLSEKQGVSSVIFCVCRSALSITKNRILHGRTKHIDTRFHFIRDLIKDEIIEVRHCKTEEQIADIFTKALPKYKFETLRTKLGVCDLFDQREGVEV